MSTEIPRVEDIRLHKRFEGKLEVRVNAYTYRKLWFLPKSLHPGASVAEIQVEQTKRIAKETFKDFLNDPVSNRVCEFECVDIEVVNTLKAKKVQFTVEFELFGHSKQEVKHWLGILFTRYELDICSLKQCDLQRQRQ